MSDKIKRTTHQQRWKQIVDGNLDWIGNASFQVFVAEKLAKDLECRKYGICEIIWLMYGMYLNNDCKANIEVIAKLLKLTQEQKKAWLRNYHDTSLD